MCVLFVSISQVIGCEDRLRNDLYCVEWGVKLYSHSNSKSQCLLTYSPPCWHCLSVCLSVCLYETTRQESKYSASERLSMTRAGRSETWFKTLVSDFGSRPKSGSLVSVTDKVTQWTGSTLTAVGRSQLLVRWLATHSRILSTGSNEQHRLFNIRGS